MIESIVRDYLASELSVPVVLERPMSAPISYVFIDRTGGGESNHIKRAQFAIQSYGATLYDAAALNEAVKDAMERLVERKEISSCKLNSDYDYTDPTTKRYRYQAVFDLIFY